MQNRTGGTSNPKLIAVLALAFGVVVFDRNAMGFVGPFVAADRPQQRFQVAPDPNGS